MNDPMPDDEFKGINLHHALPPLGHPPAIGPLNDADFVHLWQTSGTFREVVNRSGLTRMVAARRAIFLRRKGVALKKFVEPKGSFAGLARLAKTLEPKA
jgi:hypothetical protein